MCCIPHDSVIMQSFYHWFDIITVNRILEWVTVQYYPHQEDLLRY